jgi:hypothetical protein
MSLGHGDDAETPHIFGPHAVDRFAVEQNLAAGRRQCAGDGQDQRALAGAVGA